MVFCLFSSAAFLFDSSVLVIMILGSAHFQSGRFTPLAHVWPMIGRSKVKKDSVEKFKSYGFQGMTSNLNQCLKKRFLSFKMKLGGFPPVPFLSPLEKENAWWQVVGEGTVSLRVAELAPQVKRKRGNTRYWSPWPYEVTIPSPLFHLAGGGYGYT